MHFNDLYAGIDLQVMRINSERPRFPRKEQDCLDEVVRRAQNILDTHQIMYEDDLSEDESVASVQDGPSHDDTSVPSDDEKDNVNLPSISPLFPGEDGEPLKRKRSERSPTHHASSKIMVGATKTRKKRPPSCEVASHWHQWSTKNP